MNTRNGKCSKPGACQVDGDCPSDLCQGGYCCSKSNSLNPRCLRCNSKGMCSSCSDGFSGASCDTCKEGYELAGASARPTATSKEGGVVHYSRNASKYCSNFAHAQVQSNVTAVSGCEVLCTELGCHSGYFNSDQQNCYLFGGTANADSSCNHTTVRASANGTSFTATHITPESVKLTPPTRLSQNATHLQCLKKAGVQCQRDTDCSSNHCRGRVCCSEEVVRGNGCATCLQGSGCCATCSFGHTGRACAYCKAGLTRDTLQDACQLGPGEECAMDSQCRSNICRGARCCNAQALHGCESCTGNILTDKVEETVKCANRKCMQSVKHRFSIAGWQARKSQAFLAVEQAGDLIQSKQGYYTTLVITIPGSNTSSDWSADCKTGSQYWKHCTYSDTKRNHSIPTPAVRMQGFAEIDLTKFVDDWIVSTGNTTLMFEIAAQPTKKVSNALRIERESNEKAILAARFHLSTVDTATLDDSKKGLCGETRGTRTSKCLLGYTGEKCSRCTSAYGRVTTNIGRRCKPKQGSQCSKNADCPSKKCLNGACCSITAARDTECSVCKLNMNVSFFPDPTLFLAPPTVAPVNVSACVPEVLPAGAYVPKGVSFGPVKNTTTTATTTSVTTTSTPSTSAPRESIQKVVVYQGTADFTLSADETDVIRNFRMDGACRDTHGDEYSAATYTDVVEGRIEGATFPDISWGSYPLLLKNAKCSMCLQSSQSSRLKVSTADVCNVESETGSICSNAGSRTTICVQRLHRAEALGVVQWTMVQGQSEAQHNAKMDRACSQSQYGSQHPSTAATYLDLERALIDNTDYFPSLSWRSYPLMLKSDSAMPCPSRVSGRLCLSYGMSGQLASYSNPCAWTGVSGNGCPDSGGSQTMFTLCVRRVHTAEYDGQMATFDQSSSTGDSYHDAQMDTACKSLSTELTAAEYADLRYGRLISQGRPTDPSTVAWSYPLMFKQQDRFLQNCPSVNSPNGYRLCMGSTYSGSLGNHINACSDYSQSLYPQQWWAGSSGCYGIGTSQAMCVRRTGIPQYVGPAQWTLVAGGSKHSLNDVAMHKACVDQYGTGAEAASYTDLVRPSLQTGVNSLTWTNPLILTRPPSWMEQILSTTYRFCLPGTTSASSSYSGSLGSYKTASQFSSSVWHGDSNSGCDSGNTPQSTTLCIRYTQVTLITTTSTTMTTTTTTATMPALDGRPKKEPSTTCAMTCNFENVTRLSSAVQNGNVEVLFGTRGRASFGPGVDTTDVVGRQQNDLCYGWNYNLSSSFIGKDFLIPDRFGDREGLTAWCIAVRPFRVYTVEVGVMGFVEKKKFPNRGVQSRGYVNDKPFDLTPLSHKQTKIHVTAINVGAEGVIHVAGSFPGLSAVTHIHVQADMAEYASMQPEKKSTDPGTCLSCTQQSATDYLAKPEFEQCVTDAMRAQLKSCKKGQFYNSQDANCDKCPQGTYANVTGERFRCTSCPDKQTSAKESTRKADCIYPFQTMTQGDGDRCTGPGKEGARVGLAVTDRALEPITQMEQCREAAELMASLEPSTETVFEEGFGCEDRLDSTLCGNFINAAASYCTTTETAIYTDFSASKKVLFADICRVSCKLCNPTASTAASAAPSAAPNATVTFTLSADAPVTTTQTPPLPVNLKFQHRAPCF